MTDITVKIGAKQGPSGITDDLAEKLHNGTLNKLVGVVELHVEETRERVRDGKETVVLSIGNLEPAVDQIGEDHLREFQRALHMNRKLHSPDAQLTIDTAEDLEPKVADVIAARPGLVHHDFMPQPDTPLGEEPRCELAGCSEFENAPIHHPIVADPFTVPDDVDDEPPAEDSDDVDDEPITPYSERTNQELWNEIERRNTPRPDNGLPLIVPDFNRKADLVAALERDDSRHDQEANAAPDGD